uniref:sushi, von Willebrand factor type A, EGF and pentraxin domain-containing protein 1-like isoform X2 n=1 Tax=Styela clava TaxID=7725 RepID=UPI0019393794|nr:sushi, von Willebrand factor type A, EGF and pentraxin domain-containing protein 1-like isoform X2 [Styela clava]
MLHNKKIVAVVILICAVCLTTSQDCQARDEAAAIEEDPTRECRKECLINADCTGNKSCLCDDKCGLSCYNPDAECPDLTGTLANGVISMPDGRKYGAKAKHTCNGGYYRVGIEKRICRSTRKWSHVQTNCTRGCDPPPTVNGAYADTDPDILGYQPGQTVTYNCNTGYEGAGNFMINCQTDYEWSPINFYCQRKNCGAPETISNGAYTGTSFLFGDSITYYCNTGYDISGTATRKCMADAKWLPEEAPPTCKIRTCPAPKAPEHGTVDTSTAPDLEYNQIVTYKCDTGYKMQGSNTGTCDENGSWGAVPTCLVAIECGFEELATSTCGYTVVSGTFTRTYRDADGTGFPGYALVGNGKIRSGALPLAGNDEQCMSVDIKGISKDELVAYAYNGVEAETKAIWPFPGQVVASTSWKTEKFKLKKVKSADTEVQLELVASGDVELDNIKTLSSSDCDGLDTPCAKQNLDHGTIEPNKDLYIKDEAVTYSCNGGYNLEGGSTGTCKADGSWTTTPVCKSTPTTTESETPTTTSAVEPTQTPTAPTTTASETQTTTGMLEPTQTSTASSVIISSTTPSTTQSPGSTESPATAPITNTSLGTLATTSLETPTTTTSDIEGRVEKPGSGTPATPTSTSTTDSTGGKPTSSTPSPHVPFPPWAIAIIVIALLAFGGIGGYFGYKAFSNSKGKDKGYTSATPEAGRAPSPPSNNVAPTPTTTV